MRLKINMSKPDQIIRGILGCLFLTTAFTEFVFTDLMSRTLIGFVGAIALFSAMTGFCMLYEVTGLGTQKSAK